MAKASSKSTGGKFPKGGSGHMFPKQHAGPQKPGVSGKSPSGDGGKFPSGGKGKMFGKGSARPAVAGATAKSSN